MFFLAAAAPGSIPELTWSQFFNHYLMQDTLVVLVLLAIALLVSLLLRRAHWRAALKMLYASKVAVACSIICGFFGVIALLDSIYYPAELHNADGTVVTDEKGSVVSQPPYFCDSLLDRVLSFGKNHERTYSEPMAAVEFGLSVDEKTGERNNRPLVHPGAHLLGTNQIGVDVLYMCFKGVRTAMVLGALTTLMAAIFATIFGIMAGFFGGLLDDLIQYVYITVGSIPDVLLIIAFISVFGRGLFQLCAIMGITSWVGLCRLLRAETLKLRETDYVMAARALGVPWYKILVAHILPNVLHIILISLVLRFSSLVLAEAVLSYIGVGLDPSTISWGNMINSAKEELSRDPIVWWILLGAFLSILALVFPANLLGDQVRDALDPRLRKGED
ncbi:MAG TPA: ABC transporter permease [Planctomycetota bacterium]|nr:ABC transporter permease [Planctomycetota bacterium]